MELRNIKSFLRAAELQNFTHAADDLGYSQATITMQIKQLEEELGTPLFERFGRNVKLTQHGEIFARRAAVILSEVDSAVAELNDDEIKGDLTIASADSVCMHILPGILMEFRKKCPKVHVSIKTGIDVALHEMIQKNEIDLMFMLGEMEHRSEWIHVVDKEEQAIFVASKCNPLAKSKKTTLRQIAEQPLFLTEKDPNFRIKIDKAAAEQGFEIAPLIDVNHTSVIVDALLADNGVSYLAEFIVKKNLEKGELVKLETDEAYNKTWIQLVYHKNKILTPQIKIFMEIARKKLLGDADGTKSD